MSWRTPLHSRLWIVGGCLMLAVLYSLSTSIDRYAHHAYVGSIQTVEILDARLSQDVLRLRYGLLGHYDGIVDDVAAIERIQARLLDPPEFVTAARREALTAAVRDYNAAMNEKVALVEQFKSTNAGLRGSLLYFPIATRHLIERAGPDVADRARTVLEAVLEYEVSDNPSNLEKAHTALARLEDIGSSLTPEQKPLLETALAHARNVLSRCAELDLLIDRIDKSSNGRRMIALKERYQEADIAAHERAEQFRWLLFLVGSLTAAGAVQALRALARAKAELEQANENLDRRVRDRTQELAAAKELLERDATNLLALNEELEVSNRELDDFAYIVSHDLKEPLRGIRNYASFLIDDYAEKLDESGQNKLETLGRLASRMDDLIETLLHFSRVGRTELAWGMTSIEEIVEEVIDSLHISLEERGVEVRIPEPLPEVYCDRVRVTEVFRNLVSNALKYNDKPQPWIEIGCRRASDENDAEKEHTAFYVRDNGIGIREKHLESVFLIFKRLHGRDKFGGGTGAGLSIVKKIVERHDGRIWVDSEFGEGTTFHLDLGGRELGSGNHSNHGR